MARRSSRGRSPGGVLALLQRTGVRKGVFGNSRGWLYVGAGVWTLRTVRRVAERKPEILLSEELRPGERLMISNGRATVDGDPIPVVRTRGGKLRARRGAQG
jgi:hypothetical protein